MIKRLAPLLSAVLLALAACGGGGPTLQDFVPVAVVRLDAGADSVIVGRELQLSAIALDASGRELTGRLITWASGSPEVATVSASGRVTGLLPGVVTFTATSGGVSASMVVRVRPVAVASVTVTPATTTVVVGATVNLAAMPRDAAGNLLTNRPPMWSTGNAAIAQVSANGLVTGVAPGQVTITANVDGRTGSSVVTVLPMPVTTVAITPGDVMIFAGATQDLTAVTRGAGGVVLTGRAVQWSSANPAVAAVSATGVVTGVGPGLTFVTATVEGRTAQARVIVRIPGPDVTDPEITSFSVQPASIDVTSGPGTFTFTWTVRDYGSGVTNVYVSLNYPNNPGATQGCSGVSGPLYEASVTCTVTFAQNSPSRTWSIEYISAQDVAGNRTQTSSLAARGWPTQVTVTGAAADETPPAP